MKKLILFCLTVLIFSSISAVRINEIEMNPEDGSSGKEWIELYNDENEDIDISDWEIWEGIYGSSGPKKILSIPEGTIIEKDDFYIIECQNKLNNKGDFVILYNNNGEEVDKTETLEESSSSTKTWQLCDSWEFLEATKGEKNKCENEEEPEEKTEEEKIIEENQEIKEEPKAEELKVVSSGSITPEVIKLEPLETKDIKREDDKKVLDKSQYVKYGFVVFCILLGFLFILKNRRKQKNELV